MTHDRTFHLIPEKKEKLYWEAHFRRNKWNVWYMEKSGGKWRGSRGKIKVDICLELSPLLSHKAVNRSFHFWYQARWAETKEETSIHSINQSIAYTYTYSLSLSHTHMSRSPESGDEGIWLDAPRSSNVFWWQGVRHSDDVSFWILCME